MSLEILEPNVEVDRDGPLCLLHLLLLDDFVDTRLSSRPPPPAPRLLNPLLNSLPPSLLSFNLRIPPFRRHLQRVPTERPPPRDPRVGTMRSDVKVRSDFLVKLVDDVGHDRGQVDLGRPLAREADVGHEVASTRGDPGEDPGVVSGLHVVDWDAVDSKAGLKTPGGVLE